MYPKSAQQNAAMQSTLGGASISPVPTNPIRAMADAHERLKETAIRFHAIMQKVIGNGYSSPKTQGVSANRPPVSNLFDALQDTAAEQHGIISAMNEALAALENKLQ